MSYSPEVYARAQRELTASRLKAQTAAQQLHEEMRKNPRVCELESVMARSVGKLSRAILSGTSEQEIPKIKEENLAAQAELASLLAAAGQTVTNFEPQYACTHCQDTGYVNGQMCHCFRKLLRRYAAQQLTALTGMRPQSFDTLELSYYSDQTDGRLGCSPREHMKGVIEYGRWYGESFTTDRPNLLLRGATGTGKTHLSLAIAAKACENGANVIYGSVQTLLHVLEGEHFGRAEGDTEKTLTHCDLLILDDLGTEFASPFYTSALYALINERLLAGRPTVISTNLDAAAIYDRYGEQIASRLIGTYEPLVFVGQDIRQQKLQRRLQ